MSYVSVPNHYLELVCVAGSWDEEFCGVVMFVYNNYVKCVVINL